MLPSLAVAASAPRAASDPWQVAVETAERERAAAEAEGKRLEQAASKADNEAARLAAMERALAQQVNGAEARITAAEMRLRMIGASLSRTRARLAEQQRPVAGLLTGLAIMADRPPLLALVGGQGGDDLVEVRILLDSTIPVVRARTASLAGRLQSGERLEQAAAIARAELVASRRDLEHSRIRFADLERRANVAAAAAGGAALGAGDAALDAAEQAERLRGAATGRALSEAIADALARDARVPIPQTVVRGGGKRPLSYVLPARARVVDGLGAVDANGLRSRGITLDTARGTPLVAPADGTIRFAGPFREHDGVVILDHGNGWMSLLIGAGTDLRPGARVRLGETFGRAMGPLTLELSQNGKYRSAALIAGSSAALSNAGKGS
jgi:septal ring factor EnvC (AmiA/AmiB activator)